MKHAKYFSIFVFMLIAFYGAIGFYCLPLAAYQGDLTRIGMLPESLFGWTKAQPAIDPALLQQSSWQDADLLVVGDSFSEPRVWQAILTGHGLHVRTEHWLNIRDICEDFTPWLRAQGFKGKYVVIESIERDAHDHFANSARCKQMHVQHRVDADKPQEPPITILNHDKRNYSGRMSVGIKTRINMYRYEKLSSQPGFKTWATDGVRVTHVPQGCEIFSHLRCRDALFLGLDSDQDLGVDVINNMEIINTRFEGLTPIWVIVPNKSTAYLFPDKRFWDMLAQRLRSINLLRPIRQSINDKAVDVYPASYTHLSTQGYLLMGEEIYRNIQHGHDIIGNARTTQ